MFYKITEPQTLLTAASRWYYECSTAHISLIISQLKLLLKTVYDFQVYQYTPDFFPLSLQSASRSGCVSNLLPSFLTTAFLDMVLNPKGAP